MIGKEYEDDPAAARSELGGEWRDGVAEFVPRAMIEALVVPGRQSLLPRDHLDYHGGADLSGGRNDSATLSILHKEWHKLVDLSEHILPDAAPAIYLTTRPDLGDVAKGRLITIDNQLRDF